MAYILQCIQDVVPLTVAYIQKTFEISFSFAKKIYETEMGLRKAIKAREEERIELHLHTRFTAFGSVTSIEEYCKRAKERGVKAIAITDYGSVQSFSEGHAAGEKYGIKIIYGCEFLIDFEKEGGIHRTVVLAKNQKGLELLYGFVTESLTKGVMGHDYFLPKEHIKKDQSDLLFGLSTCDKAVVERIESEDEDSLWSLFSRFDYVEVNPPSQYDPNWLKDGYTQEDVVSRVVEMATETGIPVIATADVNCVDDSDQAVMSVLGFCKERLTKGNSLHSRIKSLPFRPYLKRQAMLDCFAFLGEEMANRIVLDNPFLLADRIEPVDPSPRKGVALPALDGAEERIRELCKVRLHELYKGEQLDQRVSRINKELGLIHKSGAASIFYACHLLVKKAHEDGHVVLCRGSLGNSLIAYLLGITEIESGLPLEMLYGIDGDQVPDLDLSFSTEYLHETQAYLKTLFGEDNVVRAGTVETIPYKTAMNLAKEHLDVQRFDKEHVFEGIANRIVNAKRTLGQNPNGFVVLPSGHRWEEFTPLQYPSDSTESSWRVTHLPYSELRGSLYKFDLLGSWSLLLLERLLSKTGIQMADIPLDDPSLAEALTGQNESVTLDHLPEYGTAFAWHMMEIIKPKTTEDLIKVSGLAHGTGTWDYYQKKFLSGEIKITNEILSNRDDLFLFLTRKGFSQKKAYEITESVRKGRGLSQEQEDLMLEHGVSRSYVGACKSIRYLFPKAHIMESLRISLALAFIKLKYPQAFEEVYADIFS